jgi:hypothetical protein
VARASAFTTPPMMFAPVTDDRLKDVAKAASLGALV